MTECKRCGKFPLHMTEGEFHQAMQEAARAENRRVLDEVEKIMKSGVPARIGSSPSEIMQLKIRQIASLRLEGEKK